MGECGSFYAPIWWLLGDSAGMDGSSALPGDRSGVSLGVGGRSGSRSIRARGRGGISLAANKPARSRLGMAILG